MDCSGSGWGIHIDGLVDEVESLRKESKHQLHADVTETAMTGLKFSQCLPPDLATKVLAARIQDVDALSVVLDGKPSLGVKS